MRTTPKNTRRARDRRWLLTDDLGSIVAVTDTAGRAMRINTQRPYGQPNTNNLGRFQFAAREWLPEIGVSHNRAHLFHQAALLPPQIPAAMLPIIGPRDLFVEERLKPA